MTAQPASALFAAKDGAADVLRLLARGMSSKEIASRLVISPKTARNHIEHIYVKIGASSRAAASLFAMQHGLLSDEYPITALR